ncbi:peptidase inhibitor family I36 protein [Kibdelosporangium aridum]|uniref:Uncharacterized protein n=1 Tax=Kibdelosporangium aridum TaxID=2030 RepID=A0A1W2AYE0_KIBAR|nr:peptidase inhibitor family I36 protein [Kibdelosporangium aridum]SMC65634.1 hypothetical protein SAMN05661093_01194 [Kibdelosporangium aridum]
MSVPRVSSLFGLVSSVIAVVALASAPAAQAETTSPTTIAALRNVIGEAGEFCLFRDRNLTGPVLDFARAQDDLAYSPFQWPIVGGQVNDQASSARNNTTCAVQVFHAGQHNGRGVTIPPCSPIRTVSLTCDYTINTRQNRCNQSSIKQPCAAQRSWTRTRAHVCCCSNSVKPH